MRKRLPRSRFNQDVIVTDAERKKLKDTYCSGINEIKNVFDYVIDYQKKSNNMRFYDEYNFIRVSAVILRLYSIPISEIINFKNADINMKSGSINKGNYIVNIDNRLFEYIKRGFEFSTMLNSEYLICNSNGNQICTEEEFTSFLSTFRVYMKNVLNKTDCSNLQTISISALRDSIIFEKIFEQDRKIKFTHDFKLLKSIFVSEFITKDCSQSNVSVKVNSKYDLYLKWFKVFYEEAAWANGEF